MLYEQACKKRIKNATRFSWKAVIFHVGMYPVKLINHAWTARIHSYLHIFKYAAKCCFPQEEGWWFVCSVTVTLVSCPSCVFWVLGPFQGSHWKRHESASINEMRRLISLWLTARGRTVAAFIQLRCLCVYCHNIYMYSMCVCVRLHKMNECVSSEKKTARVSNGGI